MTVLPTLMSGIPELFVKFFENVKNTSFVSMIKLCQTEPCRRTGSFCNSRHWMTCVAFENRAWISIDSMGSVGNRGWITRLTRKWFFLAAGVTAVHLLKSSFLGFREFMALTQKASPIARFTASPNSITAMA